MIGRYHKYLMNILVEPGVSVALCTDVNIKKDGTMGAITFSTTHRWHARGKNERSGLRL
jgi:hypothetical protein